MLPQRLLHLVQAALLLQETGVSAFSSVASRAKIRHTRNAARLWSAVTSVGCDDDSSSDQNNARQSSHIVSIKSSNIAGMVNDGEEGTDIKVDFGPKACLVAVTGESGAGKSLLISKAIDLVTGGKVVSSLVPPLSGENSDQESSSWIELNVNLYEPQLSSVSSTLQKFGIDPSTLYNEQSTMGQLCLKRTLSSNNSGRIKSVCRINGKHISLKTLRQIASPLFTRVDVGVASAALGRPASRLTMVDMGVPDRLKENCAKQRDTYKEARKRTEKIKHDLESRVLPSSLQGGINRSGFDEEQMKLLDHWVDELDSFETRINRFQESLLAQYNELVSDESNEMKSSGSSGIVKILHNLQKASWGDESDSEDGSIFTSLLDFREGMKEAEMQLVSAHSAYESLASLTAPNSALVALENTRKLLYSISSDDSGPLFETIEKTHELLNDVENSLDECARSIDGKLLSTLENMAFTGVPIEEVEGIIADWSALARKHGISPYSLPNCHMSIRQELDGNVEALKLLPEAEENERVALDDYSHACKELSHARKSVASKLSQSVTEILPSLGLEGSAFLVRLSLRPGGFEDPYFGSETVGVDISDFLFLHQKNNGDDGSVGVVSEAHSNQRGGKIEQVGSSGEKSRVLLAIETASPGSIGSTCNSFSNSAENLSCQGGDLKTPPISIVYDEIDAHVGGRAAVTMAKLLANQSRNRHSSDNERMPESGSQIIAITHSASLAATADRHIVVERGMSSRSTSVPIQAYVVDGSSRRKEIARMASGDLASEEAETFADALMRDALLHREASPS
ncbi:hypothetical protein ACHAXR_005672 [Thalassiosira sp. AJA248-18]